MATNPSRTFETHIASFAWRYDFTKEDVRCIIQITEGKTNSEIAGEFRCTEDAVVARVNKILQRMNAKRRTHVATKFLWEVFITADNPEAPQDFALFVNQRSNRPPRK